MEQMVLPACSSGGYAHILYATEDLALAAIRNFLGDLRQFAVWSKARWEGGRKEVFPFLQLAVSTLPLIDYRLYSSGPSTFFSLQQSILSRLA